MASNATSDQPLPSTGEEGAASSFSTLKKPLASISGDEARGKSPVNTKTTFARSLKEVDSKERLRSKSPKDARKSPVAPLGDIDIKENLPLAYKSNGNDHSTFFGVPKLPQAADATLGALKYLPTPLLVLSSQKTVLLANDAMTRLLGLDPMDEQELDSDGEDADQTLSLNMLRGQTLSQLGIEVVDDSKASSIGWEVSCEIYIQASPFGLKTFR